MERLIHNLCEALVYPLMLGMPLWIYHMIAPKWIRLLSVYQVDILEKSLLIVLCGIMVAGTVREILLAKSDQ